MVVVVMNRRDQLCLDSKSSGLTSNFEVPQALNCSTTRWQQVCISRKCEIELGMDQYNIVHTYST